jgi:hypothetical protein
MSNNISEYFSSLGKFRATLNERKRKKERREPRIL